MPFKRNKTTRNWGENNHNLLSLDGEGDGGGRGEQRGRGMMNGMWMGEICSNDGLIIKETCFKVNIFNNFPLLPLETVKMNCKE